LEEGPGNDCMYLVERTPKPGDKAFLILSKCSIIEANPTGAENVLSSFALEDLTCVESSLQTESQPTALAAASPNPRK
jgi:hypothetical protein